MAVRVKKIVKPIERVMGIDQASTGPCGFGLISRCSDQEPALLDWYTESYDGLSNDRRGRFRRYTDVFLELYARWKPDLIVIEQVRKRGPGGVIFLPTIAALSSVIALTVVHSDVPVYSVPTSHWKSVVVGGMTKTNAIDFIGRRFGKSLGEHASEASCLALYPFAACEVRKWKKEH